MDLIERDVGSIPVSIGTSLAIEGFLGIHPNQPKHSVDVKTIKEVWINIRTLARNLYQSIPTDQIYMVNPNEAVELIVKEMQTIPVALGQYGSKAKVKYYIASKDAVKWKFPKATFKEAKTSKQVAFDVFERYVSIEILSRLKEEVIPYSEIDTNPVKTQGTVAILTHFPHELLWKEFFDRLLLLESHTGRLKPYNLWYTKLNGIDEADTNIPFTRFTLQVFGDGVLIDAQKKELKGQLKQLAKNKRWSPVTTQDKIYHDITTYGTKEIKEAYALYR